MNLGGSGVEGYNDRVAQEVELYADMEEVHDLPAIYAYWASRYCLPLLHELGYESLNAFWDEHVAEVCRRRAPDHVRLVSLGAGNGDVELGVADRLAAAGIHNLELVLLELNPRMLERARSAAQTLGIADRLVAVEVDLNQWSADAEADVYFANHSLHHVVALETLFDEVERTLRPGGVLLVNDMIGRNGHRRWPEAAALIHNIWSVIPEHYRFNPIHGRPDPVYPDIDCAQEGFEGVRAQDILPLLLERFHPEAFVTFANLIDPFVDRVYGPNLDPESAEDRRFIDRVAQLDDAALDLGIITPTHLIASFRAEPCAARFPRERSPRAVVRHGEPSDEDGEASEPQASTLGELEALLAEKECQLASAWGHYNNLRSRKAVRAALALVDFARHPLRRGSGG